MCIHNAHAIFIACFWYDAIIFGGSLKYSSDRHKCRREKVRLDRVVIEEQHIKSEGGPSYAQIEVNSYEALMMFLQY